MEINSVLKFSWLRVDEVINEVATVINWEGEQQSSK